MTRLNNTFPLTAPRADPLPSSELYAFPLDRFAQHMSYSHVIGTLPSVSSGVPRSNDASFSSSRAERRDTSAAVATASVTWSSAVAHVVPRMTGTSSVPNSCAICVSPAPVCAAPSTSRAFAVQMLGPGLPFLFGRSGDSGMLCVTFSHAAHQNLERAAKACSVLIFSPAEEFESTALRARQQAGDVLVEEIEVHEPAAGCLLHAGCIMRRLIEAEAFR
eukprot:CAMPEP_0181231032 /NCGR_PEP_ID=MMETSP1096-20121128/34851_1 /TAXON_ID=156174 ORGANISM="Chrysochromulina ericina, Strain CCMP281" /NCGR_SAMPLE_ID=MMETSP1096 /ASSEMBLY_ACC=CAM_ASM_000453 /LENGTH=218 /DNA_ID=CAMNT_0023324969 /DNA_START=104 /DNA_END=756 /DNA_ORIENTATION=+